MYICIPNSILLLILDFLKNSFKVTVLDNFMHNQASLLDSCSDKNLTVIRGDVRDTLLIKKCLREADAIFPLACLTGAPLCDKNPFEAKAVIVGSIKSMLKFRSKKQIIIYPTTNSGYGIGQKGKFCTEVTPLRPVSLYGKLKVEAEKALCDAGNSISLRLATAFGISPRMRLDLLVNEFTYRALRDRFIVLYQADFKRNFIHVRDVAGAFLYCLNNFSKMKNQVYNVGLSNANLSKLGLCQEIKKQLPDFYFVEAKVGSDIDKRDYIVSNEKIERSGFKPAFSLQDGISELIKGYQIIRLSQFSNV